MFVVENVILIILNMKSLAATKYIQLKSQRLKSETKLHLGLGDTNIDTMDSQNQIQTNIKVYSYLSNL